MKKSKHVSIIAIMLASITLFTACSRDASNITDQTTNNTATSDGTTNISDTLEEIYTGNFEEEVIPTVYITTDSNRQITSKTEYSDITIRFKLNDRYSEYTSTYTDEDGGVASLKCRGNSTYTKDEMRAKNKYSYKLKLDSAENLLGMGSNKHWYLLANWFDVTAMRNKLAYDLSGSLGMSYTQSTWVVLYYNGEYRGLYSLVESLKIDEGRVETFNWENFAETIADRVALDYELTSDKEDELAEAMKADLSWITTGSFKFYMPNPINPDRGKAVTYDLTGYFDPDELDLTSGYLIEYDGRLDGDVTKWWTNRGIPVMMDNPVALSTNEKMYNYVRTLIQDFEDAVFSDTLYNSKGKHYSEYVDVNSLVNFWMIWTVFNNIEFGYLSLYYYIDDGKIVFGPCWDFDNASGNIVTLNDYWERWDRWNGDRGAGWFRQILKDPYFTSLCQEKWFGMREAIDDMMQSLDIYYKYISEEAIKCYKRNGPRTNWYLWDRNGGKSYDFDTDFQLLKDWLTNHIQWLDQNMSIIDPNIDDSQNIRSTKIFADLTFNGSTPETDKITSFGVVSDYIISPDASGTFNLTVSTTHTTSEYAEVYINGTTALGRKKCNTSTTATYTFSTDNLNMEDGALNVIYIPSFREDGGLRSMTSIYIRVTSAKNPNSGEFAVTFGDDVVLVKKGQSVTVPEYPYRRQGFAPIGWSTTDGEVYKPGDTFTPSSNTYLYISWGRLDMNSFMILDEIIEK